MRPLVCLSLAVTALAFLAFAGLEIIGHTYGHRLDLFYVSTNTLLAGFMLVGSVRYWIAANPNK